MDASHGWALGYFAEPQPGLVTLQRTDDGGRSWQLVTPPTSEPGRLVRGVVFATTDDGWAFGPAMYATHDGGSTWERVRLGAPIAQVQPAGHSVWALADGRILATTVGSDRWHRLDGAPVATGPLQELVRAGSDRAWFLWRSGAGPHPASSHLATTVDGGLKWTTLSVPCGDFYDQEDLAAASARDLWLVCGAEPGGGSEYKDLYLSHDGGRHWIDKGDAPYPGYDAEVVPWTATAAWFADVGSPLLETADGGHTWTTVVSRLDDSGWGSVAMVGEHAWIAYRDTLFRTSVERPWTHLRLTPDGCG